MRNTSWSIFSVMLNSEKILIGSYQSDSSLFANIIKVFPSHHHSLLLIRIAEVMACLDLMFSFATKRQIIFISILMHILEIIRHSKKSSFSAGIAPQGFHGHYSSLTVLRNLEVLLFFALTVVESKHYSASPWNLIIVTRVFWLNRVQDVHKCSLFKHPKSNCSCTILRHD